MKYRRKGLSKRQRYEILRRDGFRCRYCGACAPDVRLHVDHITPLARGGSDDPSNLCAACVACNLGKSTQGTSTMGDAPDWLDDYTDEMQFLYCDPFITSLYGEPVV